MYGAGAASIGGVVGIISCVGGTEDLGTGGGWGVLGFFVLAAGFELRRRLSGKIIRDVVDYLEQQTGCLL